MERLPAACIDVYKRQDINYVVLENLYAELKDKVEFRFNYYVDKLEKTENGYIVTHCILIAMC